MKKVTLQYWEETTKDQGITPDGCSLHKSKAYCLDYIKSIYDNREHTNIPDNYERKVGTPIRVEVKEDLYNMIKKNNFIRLSQVSLVNLIKLEELIP